MINIIITFLMSVKEDIKDLKEKISKLEELILALTNRVEFLEKESRKAKASEDSLHQQEEVKNENVPPKKAQKGDNPVKDTKIDATHQIKKPSCASLEEKDAIIQSIAYNPKTALIIRKPKSNLIFDRLLTEEDKNSNPLVFRQNPSPSFAVQRNSSLNLKCDLDLNSKLFDEFFIFGVSKEIALSEEFPEAKYFPPTLLFQYPNLPQHINCPKCKSAKDFCFPHGVKIQELDPKSSMNRIQSALYPFKEKGYNGNTFIFCMNGDEDNLEEKIYCICIKFTELVTSSHENRILATEKVYCFMTKFTYFEFYNVVLRMLFSIRCYQRVLSTNNETSSPLDSPARLLAEIKTTSLMPIFENDGKEILDKILHTDPYDSISIGNQYGSFDFSFEDFPAPQNECANVFCPLMFSTLKFKDFCSLYCHLIMEDSIIFISKNTNLVASAVLACNELLRPFKWQHIIVPILPRISYQILEAPVPFIIGVNESAGELETLDTTEWCPIAVYVLLDEGILKTQMNAPTRYQIKCTKILSELYKQFQQRDGSICYSPNVEQLEAVTGILSSIEQEIKSIFVETLPSSIEFLEDGSPDFQQIIKIIRKAFPKLNLEFIKKFLGTQFYMQFLSDKYKPH